MTVPEWHESKMAVRRQPAGRGLTTISCLGRVGASVSDEKLGLWTIAYTTLHVSSQAISTHIEPHSLSSSMIRPAVS
jgi:hypothetical protein